MKLINQGELTRGIRPSIPKIDQINQLAQALSASLPNTSTIRDIAQLANATCSTYGIINKLPASELVSLCLLQPKVLASNAAEILIQRTLNIPKSGQRFFYDGDRNTPMWQSIAALTISSASGWPLFLQGEPGCGKTEAVRHFSANRTFNSRNPVYSVSCNGETQVEQFIGNMSFYKNGFRFVEGPLVQAARQGYVFLADEFNLLTPTVMIGLVPFLSARPGETFIHPEIKDPITIANGFLFVAAGNDDSERGRVKLPLFIDSLLQRFIVSNPSAKDMEGLIKKIMKADYPNINISQLQPTALRQFVDRMKDILHIKWSLRDVRRFLRRANDFLGYRPNDAQLPDQIQPISSTDIAFSFILSGHTLDEERKDMINQTVKTFGGSNEEAKNLAYGRTHFIQTNKGNYLVRAHIAMKIEKEDLFPQPLLDSLFWIRWTGTPDDQIPHESVLLVGPTCYKTTAMEFLLPQNRNIIYMTQEMQVSELIGSTSISTPSSFEDGIQSLQMSIRDALISIEYINKQENREQLVKDIQQSLKNEISRTKRGIEARNREKRHGVFRGVLYLQMCLNKMCEKVDAFQNQNKQSSSSNIRTFATIFNPSVVTLSAVLGVPLLLKSIHLPPASILERLNSLLEDPRSLVITEDIEQIFNDDIILREVNQSSSRSAPISAGFSLAATTTETGRMSLSRPLLSRFTSIYTEPYRLNIIKQLRPSIDKKQENKDIQEDKNVEEYDLKVIAERITEKDYDLIEAINNIHRNLIELHQNVTINEYIRWCRTANSLHKLQHFSSTKSAGIAALRTIVDALPDNDRRFITKEVLSTYIPQQLIYIIVTDTKERPVQQRGDVLIHTDTSHQQKQLVSKTSGIQIPIHSNAQIEVLDTIIWTKSAVDMADAILTAIAAKAITIFEGSPGRGKTVVAKAVLEALGLQCTRINLSPTTTIEDLFGREMPQADPEGGGLTTRFVPGPLTKAMNQSKDDIFDQSLPSQAILIDEINLAEPHLLELIESLMLEMGKSGRFFLPNGKEINHKSIIIVATMNSTAFSNARSALSTKLQGASHFIRLMPFNQYELDVLAKAILVESDITHEKSQTHQKIMKAHKTSTEIFIFETCVTSKHDSVTLREIIHFRMMRDACPNFSSDQLIELVYSTQFNRKTAEQFLKSVGIEQTKVDTTPLVLNGNLILSDSVQVPISTELIDGPLDLPLTSEQRRVMCLIGAGVMAHCPVALFGESGAGKTHTIRTLAQTVGRQLGVIQFNADTDNSAIIGSLEISGNAESFQELIQRAKDITERIIDARHPLSIELAASALSDQPDFSEIENILRKITKNYTQNDNKENQQELNQIQTDTIQLIVDIAEYQQKSTRNFVFKEGILLKMMRQGGWVLLDGVESAPHEVERLMSLLEENPTLTIYEGVRPMIFHGRGVKRDNQNNEEKTKLEIKDEENIEIAEGFQIFITCNDLKKLSPALRSRCFCIQMETAQEEVQLKELSESVLNQSETSNTFSIPFSRMLSNIFCNAREKSKNRKLLFSKDTFSPHRIVNAARGIGNDKITATNIAYGVQMSFIRCFKEDKDQKNISINAEKIITKIGNEKISIQSNRWEEFIKLAGQFEYATVYQFIKKKGMKWPDDADELLHQLFSIHFKGKDRTKDLHQIDNIEKIQIKDILNIFEKITIEWLKEMKISDIRRTVSVLSEVDFIVMQIYRISTPISQRFFRLHYLLEIIQPAIALSHINKSLGEKLSKKSINKDSFAGFEIDGKSDEDWMLIVARIQNTIQIFTSLPEIFPSIPVYLNMLSTYMNNFFDQEIIKSSNIKQTSIVLAEHKYIRKILQFINLMSKEDESATVVGYLARSDLEIKMYINNAPLLEKDNKTVQLILRKNQKPIICFNQQEIPAQIAEVSQTIPTSELQITPLLDIDLSSLTKQPHDEIFNMKELTAEQKLWVLTELFSDISSDLLTQNETLSELIQSIHQYRIKAIQIGKAPFGTSLLPISTKLCEKAFEICQFMNNTNKQYPSEIAENLLKVHQTVENSMSCLASYIDSANKITYNLKDIGIDLWNNVIQLLIDTRKQLIELNEIGQMIDRQRVLINDFNNQILLIENISRNTKFERESEIVIYFFRKINEPLRTVDPQKLQNNIQKLNTYLRLVKLRKNDIGVGISQISQIVDKYSRNPIYDNAVTALIEYSLREEAISKAAEDASFDNIVSILALFKQDQSVDKIVDPYIYLLEAAKKGQKLQNEDIDHLQSLSRIHLLYADAFNIKNNPVKLSEILQLLIHGDEHIVHVLQNSPHNVKFIQFPEFKPADLLSCIQFTTSSGTFSGIFAQSIDYSPFNIKNFIPQNTKDALLKCVELLVNGELRKKLEKKEIQQWNTLIPNDEVGLILRRLLTISEEIKQQQFQPEWLFDPDSDFNTLKREFSKNPGQEIAYQKYPIEYKQALIAKNEWENKRRLSVLYILLQTFANLNQFMQPQNLQYFGQFQPKPTNKETPELQEEKMVIEINYTVVGQSPQEDQIDGEEFIPKQVNVNEIQNQLIQNDIQEALKGKKVEDLLIMEYEAVRRTPQGNDNKKKVSEGKAVVPLDGTQDRHDLENIENRHEIVELHDLSLQIQSLLYAEIAQFSKPFDQNTIIPYTLQDTEVSLMVDISSSMTKLSKMKQIGAMVLATGISEILSSFGIHLYHYAFADREAIWKLSDSNHHNPQEDLMRLIDALREGGRPGSCPLDAAITSQNEWCLRKDKISGITQVAPNHLTIIISDFISAQVLDEDRDWSSENTGRCILISLNTEFNQELLDKKKVPRELYENGLIPKFTPGNNISSLCIDPKELCSGFVSPDSSKIPKILSEIAMKIITKTDQKGPVKQKSTILTICAPVQDKAMFWANLTQAHEIKAKSDEVDERAKNNFFVQIKATSNFALVNLNTTEKTILLQEPKNIETDNKWLQRQVTIENKTPFVAISRDVATKALTHSLIPNRAAEKEPSASSGQLWIPGLRRFIQSGFTYPYLFMKKSRRNQKAYSITFVIDNTQRIFSPLNISHTVCTIASILGSFALVPEGDEIVVDVIAASDEKANLLIQNIQVWLLSDWTLISDILRTADKIAGTESGLGIGLSAALQLASRRSGVGFGRRIIAFTDSIISNASEVSTLRQALIDFDANQIDVMGIGLGIAPLQLPLLFPIALYAPNPADLGQAMSVALGVSGVGLCENIIPRQLYSIANNARLKRIERLLCGNPKMYSILAKNIKERELSFDFFEQFGNTDLLYMKRDAKHITDNPLEEPYHDGAFEEFSVLVVCLYLGANEKDPNTIKQAVFDKQCGAVLKRKGFNYKFVCSYGEGLIELQRVENDRCPYTQLWLFSSEGYGELPKESKDKDTNKIVPFLEAVDDFWRGGGGLLLFCDNHPYNFEANYLLANHFIFSHGGRRGVSAIRFGGNYRGKNKIQVGPNDVATVGSFNPILHLDAPGSAKSRISLRPGLIHFSEGNTISYAVNDKDQPLTTAEQLWPFTPFAWTSENVDPPNPFILYFDPKIPPESEAMYCSETCKGAISSPGPIVLHGGFTSAFSEFGEDQTGMGRLVISISCWLTRFEERFYAAKRSGSKLLSTSPALIKHYSTKTFAGWRPKPVGVRPRHSILALDSSRSMSGAPYEQLIIAANQYIDIQTLNGGIISVFTHSHEVKTIYEQGNRKLDEEEGFEGGRNNFKLALQRALEIARRNPPKYECRVLFFTDGVCNCSYCSGKSGNEKNCFKSEADQLDAMGIQIDAIGFGLTQMERLGKGGFGVVRHVKLNASQKHMAWKEMRYETPEEIQMVDKEPFGFFVEDAQTAYLVIEYCQLGDLRKYIQNLRENNQLAWKIIGQIAAVFNELHNIGKIHQDIKPENILLTNDLKVKIADFGFATQLKQGRDFTTAKAGTFLYEAPERFRINIVPKNLMDRNPFQDDLSNFNDKPMHTRETDMWAIGIALYELLELKHPFLRIDESRDDIRPHEFMRRVLRDEPFQMSEFFSDNIKQLIKKMLNKIPSQRITALTVLEIPEVIRSFDRI
ncbi:MAG: putative serine/threonine-protein kinase PLK4 [Streblomastix strix]|uniref:Putative serine/threonine-protein kinase PLK4 n=1 Tax=Streblomastix strix TaxID=222440 RepID=A0A5J4WTV4_9EUKA|nr:MAG: putative serine/threonine-protein kinase PLK4 [Streblomastix strix]